MHVFFYLCEDPFQFQSIYFCSVKRFCVSLHRKLRFVPEVVHQTVFGYSHGEHKNVETAACPLTGWFVSQPQQLTVVRTCDVLLQHSSEPVSLLLLINTSVIAT